MSGLDFKEFCIYAEDFVDLLCYYIVKQVYINRMDIENIYKCANSTSRLAQKMFRAENFKLNLTKLTKLSQKYSPSQSPCEFSLNDATLTNQPSNSNLSKLNILSPRVNIVQSANNSPDRSTVKNKSIVIHDNNTGCKNCQLLRNQIKQERQQRQKYEQKLKQLAKQKEQLGRKLAAIEKQVQISSQSLQPYVNNVVFMQSHLQAIKRTLVPPQFAEPSSRPQSLMYRQFAQKKRTLDFELNFLLKTHERTQFSNNQKFARLDFLIQYLQNKTKELEHQNMELTHQNRILNSIIHDSSYVVQQRQLFHMASQELYQVKMHYKKEKSQKEGLAKLVQKLKNKIYMLTSLIGYGVVSNIENNDLHELRLLKTNIENLNKSLQQRVSLDVYGLQSIKGYKSCYSEVKQYASKDQNIGNCLYQPNFLVMFEDQQIKNALEQNVTTIIKPQFFLLVRAILDSKYLQFLTEGAQTSRFTDFTYAFIDFFRLKKNQKRIQVNLKRNTDERDYMRTSFLLRIFDRKVAYLPEMVTFRQFLIKNTPKDEVFYYLMCRNLIYKGPELDNYIICSDAYNFVSYERVLNCVQDLLQQLQKNSKIIVFNHLNQKKVMKKRKLLIKANYVLRLLLELYQKQKREKLSKLRMTFQQTCRFTKCDIIKFAHFKELLGKNFTWLTNSDICTFYRKTMAIYNGQTSTFFEAFNVSCVEHIFLLENLAHNQSLKSQLNLQQCQERTNYLIELIPDSVTQLGNQNLYQQYIGLIKMKSLSIENRAKVTRLLTKIVQARVYSISSTTKQAKAQKQRLAEILDQTNNKLIDFVNKNFKSRVKYEEQLEKASSMIGKQFKKKIYEFYSQFVKDIKLQIDNQASKNDLS